MVFAALEKGKIHISWYPLAGRFGETVEPSESLLYVKDLNIDRKYLKLSKRDFNPRRVWKSIGFDMASTSLRFILFKYIRNSSLSTIAHARWKTDFLNSDEVNSLHDDWLRENEIRGSVFLTRTGRLVWLSEHDQKFLVKIPDKSEQT